MKTSGEVSLYMSKQDLLKLSLYSDRAGPPLRLRSFAEPKILCCAYDTRERGSRRPGRTPGMRLCHVQLQLTSAPSYIISFWSDKAKSTITLRCVAVARL